MAKVCALCAKTSNVVKVRKKLRGKYNPTTKKRKYPNLQWMRLDGNKRAKVCAQCLKAQSIAR